MEPYDSPLSAVGTNVWYFMYATFLTIYIRLGTPADVKCTIPSVQDPPTHLPCQVRSRKKESLRVRKSEFGLVSQRRDSHSPSGDTARCARGRSSGGRRPDEDAASTRWHGLQWWI